MKRILILLLLTLTLVGCNKINAPATSTQAVFLEMNPMKLSDASYLDFMNIENNESELNRSLQVKMMGIDAMRYVDEVIYLASHKGITTINNQKISKLTKLCTDDNFSPISRAFEVNGDQYGLWLSGGVLDEGKYGAIFMSEDRCDFYKGYSNAISYQLGTKMYTALIPLQLSTTQVNDSLILFHTYDFMTKEVVVEEIESKLPIQMMDGYVSTDHYHFFLTPGGGTNQIVRIDKQTQDITVHPIEIAAVDLQTNSFFPIENGFGVIGKNITYFDENFNELLSVPVYDVTPSIASYDSFFISNEEIVVFKYQVDYESTIMQVFDKQTLKLKQEVYIPLEIKNNHILGAIKMN